MLAKTVMAGSVKRGDGKMRLSAPKSEKAVAMIHRKSSLSKGLLLAALLAAATSPVPALAKEVAMPTAGKLNGSRGNCSANAASATLMSGQDKHRMALGDRLAFPAKRGDDWKMTCSADGLTITTGTGCFYDGYIVAGFEQEAMAIFCYEGQIPAKLK
jgi:hypothetical protein|tara:strand:- start:2033 stop:2506 length:474 start_codon:yes stop_codon:yes gene_type:complete